MARHEAGEIVAAELEVGLVDHDDARAGSADALDEHGVELLPGGVVGSAEPDDAHVRRLAHEALEIERESAAGVEREHLCAGVAARDGVQLVGRLGHQRPIAAPERELRAERQHLVAAGPDHDLPGVDACIDGDRALERQVGGVGVVVGRDRRQAGDRLGVPGGCVGGGVHVEAVDGPLRECPPASDTGSRARARAGCACAGPRRSRDQVLDGEDEDRGRSGSA